MIEYKIVTGHNTDELENRVADLIDLGFKPHAGLCAVNRGAGLVWAQAMVRDGDPAKVAEVAEETKEPILSLE